MVLGAVIFTDTSTVPVFMTAFFVGLTTTILGSFESEVAANAGRVLKIRQTTTAKAMRAFLL